MEFTNLDDIENYFTDEVVAAKYLSNLRWGQWAKCPYCQNDKSYFIENGKRYKCANKECYKKFSITTQTLLACTNLNLVTWIKAVYLYVSSPRNIDGFVIAKGCEIADKSGCFIKSRLDFAWQYCDKTLKGVERLNELFSKMFTLYHLREEAEKLKWSNPWHISDIDNISDPASFQKLLFYTKSRLHFCNYIYINFASPGEIMSEVFVYIHDNKIKDYDADYIVKIVNRTIARMWNQYKKDHPNLWKNYLAKNKEKKRDARINLAKGYLVELAKRNKEYKEMSRGQIRNSLEILDAIKKRVTEKRKQNKSLIDFHSHFS